MGDEMERDDEGGALLATGCGEGASGAGDR